MIWIQHPISRGTGDALRQRLLREVHGRWTRLGISSVQPELEFVIGPRTVADGPAIEAMFQWVRGNRDDRERVVVL